MERKEFYSIPELAKMMHISRIAVYKKVKKGQIKAKKTGRDYTISFDEAGSFMLREEEIEEYGRQIVFKPDEKTGGIEITVYDESLWLSQLQIAHLFGVNVPAVSKHLKNIFAQGELNETAAVSKMETVQLEGGRYVKRSVDKYNLDAVISVGYRVNSSKATKFRIWATDVLKKYMVKGYAINERVLREKLKAFEGLKTAVDILARSMSDENFIGLEAELISVIKSFADSLNILQDYDDMKLKTAGRNKQEYELTFEDAAGVIEKARAEYVKQRKASALFGKGRSEKLKSLIEAVNQSFAGKDLYKTAEEKAANLLYFAVKGRPFTDGNKRIAAILFLHYLAKNRLLYRADGAKTISSGALASLTLLIAISAPAEKDTMVKVVMNVMRAG